jgi:hypothetical protein
MAADRYTEGGSMGVGVGVTDDGAVCVELCTPHAVYQLAPAVADALGEALIGLAGVAAQLGAAGARAN